MRKKAHGGQMSHDRWLVSYADFITLLFAFFVVLYSSSQVDKRKAGQLALSIQVAFQQMGIFEPSNAKIPLATSQPMPFSEVQMVENAARVDALGQLSSRPVGALVGTAQRHELNAVQRELETALQPQINRHEIAITATHEGLVVSLREAGFFDSGSATLRPDKLSTLSKLVEIIRPHSFPIRIEGHTDNVPIRTPAFKSNWELSTARATEVIRLLITRYEVSPERLSASGYSEYHPVGSNETPEGRAANRRVDLVILNPPPGLSLPEGPAQAPAPAQPEP
ncbi:MAG TPA: flagellar motor protein MotB [Candidatus Binatia bacterium]|nr:flagellar motor protein MotB [Candidatus Binatia bacterium]